MYVQDAPVHVCTHTQMHVHREFKGPRSHTMQVDRQTPRQTDNKTDKHQDRQTPRQTNTKTDRQQDRQTPRQTDTEKRYIPNLFALRTSRHFLHTHTHTHTYIYIYIYIYI